MKNFDDSVYPGKKDYDNFVSSIPKNSSEMKQDEGLALAMKAVDIFNKGIPYSDRPECIYYFYHFLNIEADTGNSEDIPEQFKSLPEYAISSLYDDSVLRYIKQLNSEKLYKVCQIRGQIMLYSSGLLDYISKKSDIDWNDLSEKIEKFINSEPSISKILLEFYLDALVLRNTDNSNESRLYEIAKLLWDTSTDLQHLKRAWLYQNDAKLIRTFKKNTLPAKEAKKVFNLEQVEKEVIAEFGDKFRDRTKVGKVFQLLSSRGREEKKQLSIMRDEWFIRIKSQGGLSMMGNDPYVKGYVSYLNAYVCAGTENWQKAIKEFKNALENNFDPSDVLILLVSLLEILKKYEDATNYTQQLIDIECVLENEQGKDYLQESMLNFKQVNRNPLWANRIWEAQAKENEQKISSIIAELEPEIKSAMNENLNDRTKAGIEILDKSVSVENSDMALNNDKTFNDVKINNLLIEFLELSLEEIEPFCNVDIEILQNIYKNSISLQDLISFNETIINLNYSEFSENFDEILSNFPNTLTCVPVAKEKIEYLLSKDRKDLTRNLADHIINQRSKKVQGIYDAIKSLLKLYHDQQNWRQEIELITNSRKILQENEYKLATVDLIEAYVQVIGNEKSLNEKNRLLITADSEQLIDERLSKIKKEVDALLNKRKQILIKVGVGVGVAIIIFIIVYFLFL